MDANAARELMVLLANSALVPGQIREVVAVRADGSSVVGYPGQVSLGASMGPLVLTAHGQQPYMGYDTSLDPAELLRVTVALADGRTPTFGGPPPGPDPAAEYVALQQRMGALYREGRFAEAVPLADQLLAHARTSLAHDPRYVTGALGNAGEMRRAAGRAAEAEPLLREAAEQSTRAFGPDDPNTRQLLSNVARLLGDLGRLDEAARYFEAWEQAVLRVEPESLEAGYALMSHGALLRLRRDHTRASNNYRRALLVFSRLDNVPQALRASGDAWRVLAAVHQEGYLGGVADCLTQAVSFYERALGPNDPATIEAKAALAQAPR